jgi:hypothetical protein
VVALLDFYGDFKFFELDIVVLNVLFDPLSRMRVVDVSLVAEAQHCGDVRASGVDCLGVDSGGVVAEPDPVVEADSDAEGELLLLDFDFYVHGCSLEVITCFYIGTCF